MIKVLGGLLGSAQPREKSYNHIAAAIRILEKKPEDPAHYRWARKVADTYQLEKNHPLNQMLVGTLSKERRERVEAPTAQATKTSSQMSQKGLAPEAFIPYVQVYGENLYSIEVTEGSDDLFQAIAACCPNLTTFIFNESASTPSFDLTDAGLVFLTQIPLLTTLEFKAFNLFNVSSNGLETLLSSPKLVSNLVHLTMNNAAFNDACYYPLSKYTQLQTLSIHGENLHYKTLSSYPVPTTVTSYTLSIGELPRDLVTDDFLNALPVNLITLSINGSFKNVTSYGFSNAMKRLTKLEHFSISSSPMQLFMLTAIKQPLKSLHLGDCSQLKQADFADFFCTQTTLVDLTVGNAIHFTQIMSLPSGLQKLYLHAPNLKSLSGFPTAIHDLTLEGIEVVYDEFAELHGIELFKLSILNCPWFNGESLKSVFKSHGERITNLSLIGTSVDNDGLGWLADFTRLTTVALGNLKATSITGIINFLSDDRVAARTRNLYFCDLYVSNDLTDYFTAFENLRVLFIGNSLAGFPGPSDIFKNPTLIKNETIISDWFGPSMYGKFLSEIK